MKKVEIINEVNSWKMTVTTDEGVKVFHFTGWDLAEYQRDIHKAMGYEVVYNYKSSTIVK